MTIELAYEFLAYVTVLAILFLAILHVSYKTRIPSYTILLILALFLGSVFKLDLWFLKPNYEIIYNIFLPLILFDSAIRIKWHDLKIQIRTLTFLTILGLALNSIFVAGLLTLVFSIPLKYTLIFGILISATDPIGVLALFDQIKVPHRLKLLVEGESMFNDAATVIFFELALLWLIEQQHGFSPFIIGEYILEKILATIVAGILLGLLIVILSRPQKHKTKFIDLVLLFGILIIFYAAEHVGLAAPLLIIILGIIYGNYSQPLFSQTDVTKERHLFSVITLFLNLYFFASIGMHIPNIPLHKMVITEAIYLIAIIILARAIAVYVTFYITNKHSFFKNEPDVPLSWQHIINIGGIRGIIPLILVEILPAGFEYKELFALFVYIIFVFTNIANVIIISYLIDKIGAAIKVHILELQEHWNSLARLVRTHSKLTQFLNILQSNNASSNVLEAVLDKINKTTHKIKVLSKNLTQYSAEDIRRALLLWAASQERKQYYKYYRQGFIPYSVLMTLKNHLDFIEFSLVYPSKFKFKKPYDKTLKPPRLRNSLLNKILNYTNSSDHKNLTIKLYAAKSLAIIHILDKLDELKNVQLPSKLQNTINAVNKKYTALLKNTLHNANLTSKA